MTIPPDSANAEDTKADDVRVDVVDWVLRTCVAVLFGSVGYEKLSPTPGSYWLTLFAEIGFGEWFVCFTGAVQVLGGDPRADTANRGLRRGARGIDDDRRDRLSSRAPRHRYRRSGVPGGVPRPRHRRGAAGSRGPSASSEPVNLRL